MPPRPCRKGTLPSRRRAPARPIRRSGQELPSGRLGSTSTAAQAALLDTDIGTADPFAGATVTEQIAPTPSCYTDELHAEAVAAAERGEDVAIPDGVDYPASALAFTGIRPGSWIISEGDSSKCGLISGCESWVQTTSAPSVGHLTGPIDRVTALDHQTAIDNSLARPTSICVVPLRGHEPATAQVFVLRSLGPRGPSTRSRISAHTNASYVWSVPAASRVVSNRRRATQRFIRPGLGVSLRGRLVPV